MVLHDVYMSPIMGMCKVCVLHATISDIFIHYLNWQAGGMLPRLHHSALNGNHDCFVITKNMHKSYCFAIKRVLVPV